MKFSRGQVSERQISTVALLGEFGPPLLAAARSFRDAGIAVVVLGIGKVSPLDWSSAIHYGASIPQEEVGTSAGLALICDFLEHTNAQALLPLWDTQMEWLAENEQQLPPGCKLLCSSKSALDRIRAKHDQLEIAARSGFSILPTWKLSSVADASAIDPAAFPICVRPSVSSNAHPRFKAEVFHSLADLESFLGEHIWGPEPLLVQPFLLLPTAVVHGVRAESGEMLELEAFFPAMRFEGISLELLPLPLHHRLVDGCRKFAEQADLTGPFHFEFLYCADSQAYHYLEVNVRLGGTTDKVVRMGFNEPLLTLAAYGFDVQITPYRFRAGRAIVNRRALLKHMRCLMRGYISPLDFPVSGRLHHWLLSLRSLVFDHDSIASTRDLRGTFYFYFGSRYAAKRAERSATVFYPQAKAS
jgi:hypothetical protein